MNTGYRRGGKSSLCIGQGAAISYKDLSTFAPKAIAGIGDLPDTVASRSIAIRLKRRAPGEHIERFRRREAGEAGEHLHEWVRSWAEHNVSHLAEVRPMLPDELGDRAADVWEPLLGIADEAAEEWGSRARKAALELSGELGDEASIRVRLLADCQLALNSHDRLATKDLIASLVADDEAPWGSWHKGSPISPRALAGLLEPFGIRSRSIRLDSGETPKGYMRESFEDAWKRYLPAYPPDLSATTPQPASEAELKPTSIRHTTPSVADEKSPDPARIEACGVVADETAPNGRRKLSEGDEDEIERLAQLSLEAQADARGELH